MKKLAYVTCLALVTGQLSLAAGKRRGGGRGGRKALHKQSQRVNQAARRSAQRKARQAQKKVVHHHHRHVHHKRASQAPVAAVNFVAKPARVKAVFHVVNPGPRRVDVRRRLIGPRPVSCFRNDYFSVVHRVYSSSFPMSATRNTERAMQQIAHHFGCTPVSLLDCIYGIYKNNISFVTTSSMDKAIIAFARVPVGVTAAEFSRVFNRYNDCLPSPTAMDRTVEELRARYP